MFSYQNARASARHLSHVSSPSFFIRIPIARAFLNASLLSTTFILSGCFETREPNVEVAGHEETTKTEVLEAGSAIVQTNQPLDPMNVYLVGFHPMKSDPPEPQTLGHVYANRTKPVKSNKYAKRVGA